MYWAYSAGRLATTSLLTTTTMRPLGRVWSTLMPVRMQPWAGGLVVAPPVRRAYSYIWPTLTFVSVQVVLAAPTATVPTVVHAVS